MSLYKVDLDIGAHSWSITEGDAPDYGPTDVQVSWSVPSGKLTAQPDPVTAKIGLVVADIGDLAGVDRGTEIALAVYVPSDAATPACEFAGRVADIAATPRRLGQGMTVALDAVDYTADLGEEMWDAHQPSGETMIARLVEILDVEGWALPTYPAHLNTVKLRGYGPLRESRLTTLAGTLWQWAVKTAAYLVPHPVVLVMADATHPRLVDVPRHITGGRYPLVLDPDGSYTFTRDPIDGSADAPAVIDACHVELPATWRRTKLDAPSRIEITAADETTVYTADLGETPPVTIAQQSDVFDTDIGGDTPERVQDIADMYLPETAGLLQWTADTFRLRLHDDPTAPGDVPMMLPPSDLAASVLNAVVVVDNIPGTQNPTTSDTSRPSTAYAGRLSGATLTVTGRKVFLDFGLRPGIPVPEEDDPYALDWDDLDPATTWDDLDPTLTWELARLARTL